MPLANALPWIAGIRSFEDEIPDAPGFVEAWRAEMRGWGIILRDDGGLLFGDHEIGRWAMADEGSLGVLESCDRGCPFVGPRLGALAFDVDTWVDPSARHELFCGLIKEGRDGVVHRPSGRSWPAVALRAERLGNCPGKASLDDGALLLTRREGRYATWICQTVSAPLRAACSEDSWRVWWISTSHNPLRLVTSDGEDTRMPFDGAGPVLDGMVELWLYDFDHMGELLDEDAGAPFWDHP